MSWLHDPFWVSAHQYGFHLRDKPLRSTNQYPLSYPDIDVKYILNTLRYGGCFRYWCKVCIQILREKKKMCFIKAYHDMYKWQRYLLMRKGMVLTWLLEVTVCGNLLWLTHTQWNLLHHALSVEVRRTVTPVGNNNFCDILWNLQRMLFSLALRNVPREMSQFVVHGDFNNPFL